MDRQQVGSCRNMRPVRLVKRVNLRDSSERRRNSDLLYTSLLREVKDIRRALDSRLQTGMS